MLYPMSSTARRPFAVLVVGAAVLVLPAAGGRGASAGRGLPRGGCPANVTEGLGLGGDIAVHCPLNFLSRTVLH